MDAPVAQSQALLERLAALHDEQARITRELAEILQDPLDGIGQAEAECPAHVDDQLRMPEAPPTLMTARDVAHRLGVSACTVRKWRRDGRMPPGVDLGAIVRWRPDVIEDWIAEREENAR